MSLFVFSAEQGLFWSQPRSMVPPPLWPALADTRDLNWITGDVQEHFLFSNAKTNGNIKEKLQHARDAGKRLHTRRGKTQEAFSPWCRTFVSETKRPGLWALKLCLAWEIPNKGDALMTFTTDYLRQRKWIGPPLCPSHAVFRLWDFLKTLHTPELQSGVF